MQKDIITKRDLFELLEEYDDSTPIRINDINNIYRSVPVAGFEIRRGLKGNIKLVLLSHKDLGIEWQP